VRNEALAEDLLSDVFLDVWRQAAKFEARSSVSIWLFAIARYKTLSARRRRIDAELDEEVSVIIADPADNPELVLQKKNQAELVRHSLAWLSPEHGLSRQIGQGGCRDRREGQDAYVLCAAKN
jgi:RNA polymerase sigma-70 factor (ECF subfamily)